MTRQQIAEGLEILTQRLADEVADPGDVPQGYEIHEWAYVKGVASAVILQLRDRLVSVG